MWLIIICYFLNHLSSSVLWEVKSSSIGKQIHFLEKNTFCTVHWVATFFGVCNKSVKQKIINYYFFDLCYDRGDMALITVMCIIKCSWHVTRDNREQRNLYKLAPIFTSFVRSTIYRSSLVNIHWIMCHAWYAHVIWLYYFINVFGNKFDCIIQVDIFGMWHILFQYVQWRFCCPLFIGQRMTSKQYWQSHVITFED